jgi:hypothetical protein
MTEPLLQSRAFREMDGKARQETIQQYLSEAKRGYNPYNIDINENWAQYLCGSSLFNWKWLLALVLGTLPTLSNTVDLHSITLNIESCAWDEAGNQSISLDECVLINNESLSVTLPYSYWGWWFLLLQIVVLLPQIVLVLFFLNGMKASSVLIWLKAARIKPGKETHIFRLWFVILYAIFFVVSILASWAALMIVEGGWLGKFYDMPYQGKTVYFELEADSSPTSFLSSFLGTLFVYSCVLTTAYRFASEPFTFFFNYSEYQERASLVRYNPETIDYISCGNPREWRSFIFDVYYLCPGTSYQTRLYALVTFMLDQKFITRVPSGGIDMSSMTLNK